MLACTYSANCTGALLASSELRNAHQRIPVSPASPEKAIKVCLLSSLVLSSEALSIVAPLMAALEAATRVKSLPVIPSRTSLSLD